MSRPRTRTAFTLVELLVTLAIVMLLVSIALPVLSRAIATARRSACLANLRSFGQSLALYRAAHNDLYPGAGAVVSLPLKRTALLDALAPYVDAAPPRLLADGACSVADPFRCPADRLFAPQHGMSYLYNLGDFMEILAIDGERNPVRSASRLADDNPGEPILSDMGDRELAQLGAKKWHQGSPWQSALYADGRAARLASVTDQPAAAR